jgi:hypothetical protein
MQKEMHVMRAATRVSLFAVIVLTLSSTCYSQTPLEDAVKQLNSDLVKGYLQPFINSASANINAGHYSTAQIPDMGFTFRLQVVGAGTVIGDAEKTYTATPPSPFAQNPVQTATVFGDRGASVSGPANMTYYFQNGQIKANLFPSVVPQLTIGSVFGTQAVLRYASIPEFHDFPRSTLFGVGAQHSISRYLPDVPVDLAVGIYYNNFSVGDFITSHAMCYGAHVSKTFAIITAYGGLQYETASMDVNYTFTGQGSVPSTTIGLQLESEVSVVATVGLDFNLGILHVNGDANFGKVTALSGGIGFGI